MDILQNVWEVISTPFMIVLLVAGLCLLYCAYRSLRCGEWFVRVAGSLAGLAGLLFVASGGGLGIPVVFNNQQLGWLSTSQALPVWRLGVFSPGDAPPIIFNSSSIACSKNSGNGDVGSQVKSYDNRCWIARTGDPRQFGIKPAVYNFYTVTTDGTTNVTIAGGTFAAKDVGSWITIFGAGPYEGRYTGQITSVVSTTVVTVSPAPTLKMESFSTIVLYGPGNSVAFNAAFAAGMDFTPGLEFAPPGSIVPKGLYFAEAPLYCPTPNVNNINVSTPSCSGEYGSMIIAASDMALSTPIAGSLFTTSNNDFSQYMRGGVVNGLGLDCNFMCQNPFSLPFSERVTVSNNTFKNGLFAQAYIGATTSPAVTGGINIRDNNTQRDTFAIPVTDITSVNDPIVTTRIDHGIATGRIVSVIGGNVVSPGPIQFAATVLGPRTLILHTDGSAWPSFATVAAGGTGYGASVSGTMTWAGSGCSTNPVFNVTTNGSGVITAVTSKAVVGFCLTPPSAIATTWTPGGSLLAGSGARFNVGSATLNILSPKTSLVHPVFNLTAGVNPTVTMGADINYVNGQVLCLFGIGVTGTRTGIPDGCYTPTFGGAGGDGPFNAVLTGVNTTGATFTGGGTAFLLNGLGDIGIYLNNVSDVQTRDNFLNGYRWPIYANPALSGYNNKHAGNHAWVGGDQGWIVAMHYLGGRNSLTDEQCDGPMIFCSWFVGPSNTVSSSGFNVFFPYIADFTSWMSRLDNGATMTILGGYENGYSSTIRPSELSAYENRGDPTAVTAPNSYSRFGFNAPTSDNVLYGMFDYSRTGNVNH